ncbi:hypothetical protein WJX72_001836 [[Myrmecia] bisecta]|uniref:DUF1664 domain-containing protein n=1 Tax=[Myrmecia] bisecta TaxID=41462 RepID=A0AAW1P1K8_9CHLO
MASGGKIVGALIGAGGASAYYNSNGYVAETLRQIWSSPNWNAAGQRSGRGGELDELYKLVEKLSKDIHRHQGITIVSTRDSSGHGVILYTAGAGVLGALYLRFVRGWRFSDLMYVTRASLKNSMAQVTEGVGTLKKQVDSVKSFLQQQIQGIRTRQDESMAKQDVMGEQLDQVSNDVENIRTDVGEVNQTVRDLRVRWDELANDQQDALHGIYALCGVVGELMQRIGHRTNAVVHLEDYVKKPRALGAKVQGLEGLLGAGADALPGPGRLVIERAQSMALASQQGRVPRRHESYDGVQRVEIQNGEGWEELARSSTA